MRYIIILTVIALLSLASCRRHPDNVLSENKMADVLADLSIADQMALKSSSGFNMLSTDSDRKIMRQSIMIHHGISEAQFDSTLTWYGHHMDDFAKLYKRVDKKLADKQTRLNKKSGINTENNDNLWPLPTMISLSNHDVYPGFSFSIPGKKFKAAQEILWKMSFNHLSVPATLFIGAEYDDMEMIYTRLNVNYDKSISMRLQLNGNRAPNRVIGYLHLQYRPQDRVFIDSISLTTAPGKSINAATSSQTHLSPVGF